MISKRLEILQALTSHLEAATYDPGGDDETLLTDRVFRGRTVFGEEVTAPFLVILERPRQILPQVGGGEGTRRKDEWQLLLQGFADDDRANPLDPAYQLLAAVELQLARLVSQKDNGGGPEHPTEYLLGRRVAGVTFEQAIVRPPDNDVSDTAYFYLPVTIRVATNMESPYSEEA